MSTFALPDEARHAGVRWLHTVPPSPPVPEPSTPPMPPGPEPPPPEIDDPPPPQNPVPVHEPPVMPTPMALPGGY